MTPKNLHQEEKLGIRGKSFVIMGGGTPVRCGWQPIAVSRSVK
jgi:hypothetical protein